MNCTGFCSKKYTLNEDTTNTVTNLVPSATPFWGAHLSRSWKTHLYNLHKLKLSPAVQRYLINLEITGFSALFLQNSPCHHFYPSHPEQPFLGPHCNSKQVKKFPCLWQILQLDEFPALVLSPGSSVSVRHSELQTATASEPQAGSCK